VGEAMIRHALRLSHERGRYEAMLPSSVNRTRAPAFYHSLGFLRQGFGVRLHLPPPGAP
jgi:ribosomal protein S18 acetylase RimI-like enzyme